MTHTKNKQIKRAYLEYLTSTKTQLTDCYTSASREKHIAFRDCLDLMEVFKGNDGKIISYNVHQFSFGFVGVYRNQPAFFYITAYNRRFIYLDEIESEDNQ